MTKKFIVRIFLEKSGKKGRESELFMRISKRTES